VCNRRESSFSFHLASSSLYSTWSSSVACAMSLRKVRFLLLSFSVIVGNILECWCQPFGTDERRNSRCCDAGNAEFDHSGEHIGRYGNYANFA
jgi:hypothetical protein